MSDRTCDCGYQPVCTFTGGEQPLPVIVDRGPDGKLHLPGCSIFPHQWKPWDKSVKQDKNVLDIG